MAGSVGASAGAVGETMRRAKAAGVTSWAEIEGLSPSALEARLYPSTAVAAKPTPDCAWNLAGEQDEIDVIGVRSFQVVEKVQG
ncbi:MAG TPA: hypothetical protein VFG23_00495 [Polyangia bacterium]|nr:hypothetical protein [Polyangia bacterium]